MITPPHIPFFLTFSPNLSELTYLLLIWFLTSTRGTHRNAMSNTTVSNGYLGSRNDEERSEMRYVMRIAEFSESSNLWTHIALLHSRQEYASFSIGSPTSILRSAVWMGMLQVSRARFSCEMIPLQRKQDSSDFTIAPFFPPPFPHWCDSSPSCDFFSRQFRAVGVLENKKSRLFRTLCWWHPHDTPFLNLIWNEVRLPAELKHINKRRKRN
jgi:hypothetical protein